MGTHFLVGPDIDLNITQIKTIFESNDHQISVYGDGKSKINCREINLPENENVIINGHGLISTFESRHRTELCIHSGETAISLKQISGNKPVNFVLDSCFGGAAIKDLPALSTMITLAPSNFQSLQPIADELIKKSASFMHYDNPFIKCASYIFTNPNMVQFAINNGNTKEIFASSIESIDNYSIDGLQTWQKQQLNKFLIFCEGIKAKMDQNRYEQIDEAIRLLKDDQYQNNWLNQFDIVRYRELLLFNTIHQSELAERNFEIVQELMKYGINVNAEIEGYSVLSIAVITGHIGVINKLIKAGASIFAVDKAEDTTLMGAVLGGHIEAVKILKTNALINVANKNGNTPIIGAALKGHIEIANILIEAGALIDAKNKKGVTALEAAASGGYIEIVKSLIKVGANVNIEDNAGFTPLDRAAKQNYIGIVKLLLAAGANTVKPNLYVKEVIVNECNSFTQNPVKYILEHNKHPQLALNALTTLEAQYQFNDLLKTKNCLISKLEFAELDLSEICGADNTHSVAEL